MVEYFVFKKVVQLFYVLVLLLFYEIFSVPVKNEKCDEGNKSNFEEQLIEWEKIWVIICKGANVQIFDSLIFFFSETFMGI